MANASESQKNKLNQELLSAVNALDIEKVSSCLEKGADSDTRNKTGDTLLNIALSNEKISPELIELLVESGAHLNYVSSDRVTPLMCAVYNINVPIETVDYLLQSGASIYSRDTYGQTPLLYATGREDIALVDLLLTYGASVNETDADGNTLLFEAVRQGYENLFSYLVDQGADLAVRDYQGTTLLMAAIEQKQEKMAHFLLDFPEIDIFANRVDGLTALDMLHDLLNENSLSDEEEKSAWQLLADAVDSRMSDRLSVFDELNEIYSEEDFDEEADEEGFIEVQEDSADDFGDFDLEEEIILSLEEEGALEEDEELPYSMDLEEDIIEEDEEELADDDFVVQENMDLILSAGDEYVLKSDEEESVDEDDDFVFALESDEEELADDSWEEEELPYNMDSEEEIVEEEELPYSMDLEEEIAEEELPYSLDLEEEIVEEEELPYSLDSEEEIVEEEELPYMMEAEEEVVEEEELPYSLDSEEEIVEEELPYNMDSEEGIVEESFLENETENRSYNPYETKNMDPWTYFETEKSRVVSQVIKVNPAEISTPLEADTVNHLPLYSQEAYQHAEKMIKRYTEYQSEDGQKGVCLSGVYLTNKACSQARVHIERGLLEEGYAPNQAHEQSVVILYKLIRANGLYHPKEFVLSENGEKLLAFKVWGCDHRLLLKSLTSEFAPEGDWYHSLHEIEKYVSEKGEGKLVSAM